MNVERLLAVRSCQKVEVLLCLGDFLRSILTLSLQRIFPLRRTAGVALGLIRCVSMQLRCATTGRVWARYF
jgi:hypothetical protein